MKLFILCFFSQMLLMINSSAIAGPLSSAEIQDRRNDLKKAYLLAAKIMPLAKIDGRIYGWLEHLHVPIELYDRVYSDILKRSLSDPDPVWLDYGVTDNNLPHCGGGVMAYTWTGDRRVSFCKHFFDMKGKDLDQAHVVIHEHFHLVGIPNECLAEASSFFVFYGANKSVSPVYLNRCADYRTWLSNLVQESMKEADLDLKAAYELTPLGAVALDSEQKATQGDCTLMTESTAKKVQAKVEYKIVKIESSPEFGKIFSLGASSAETLILKCKHGLGLTLDDLEQLGLRYKMRKKEAWKSWGS